MPVVAAGRINTVTTGRGETAAHNRLAFRLWFSDCFAFQNVLSLLCQQKNGGASARSNELDFANVSLLLLQTFIRIDIIYTIRSDKSYSIDWRYRRKRNHFVRGITYFLYFHLQLQSRNYRTLNIAARLFPRSDFCKPVLFCLHRGILIRNFFNDVNLLSVCLISDNIYVIFLFVFPYYIVSLL